MSEIEGYKLVVTFSEASGQPPLLGDEVQQDETETSVCIKCPTRAEGFEVDEEKWVKKTVKADAGSKSAESRCKTIGGVAACFHCERWGYQPQTSPPANPPMFPSGTCVESDLGGGSL